VRRAAVSGAAALVVAALASIALGAPGTPFPPPDVLPRIEPAAPSEGGGRAAGAPLPPPDVLPWLPVAFEPVPAGPGAVRAATSGAATPDEPEAEALVVPPPVGLPPVPVPDENPLTAAKVALGEALFFDPGLSVDRSVSCASCHRPGRYFADRGALSAGSADQLGERNAPTLLNAAYAPQLLWDGRAFSLEEQVRYPVTHPLEMNTTPEMVVAHVVATEPYPALFRAAFGSSEVTFKRVSQAIAAFERTLLAGGSPFDRYLAGDESAMAARARRGWELFRGKAACNRCHRFEAARPFFTDFEHYNTGVAWKDGVWTDLGRYEVTRAREDKGAFRTPSLRNVAETAPYMHDGSLASLAEVIDFYRRGGVDNPNLDGELQPVELSDAEEADLIAFLEALTGVVDYAPPAAGAGRAAR
jgi:cytochrome c peroxidase